MDLVGDEQSPPLHPFLFGSKPSDFSLAEMTVDENEKIGSAGAFKTCYFARLEPDSTNPNPNSLLRLDRDSQIVAKRMFYRDSDPEQVGLGRKKRYSHMSEMQQTLTEARNLQWASALMKVVQDHVDTALARREWATLGQPYPQVRFVHAAIAQTTDASKTFLIEERIPGTFVKYISNSSPQPVEGLSADERKLAEYFCFCQHLQYLLTGKEFFLSDFQGKHILARLSDMVPDAHLCHR